jgi:hypothetical protein
MSPFQDGDASCAEKLLIRLSWRTARRRWEGKMEKEEENAIPDEMK